MSHLAEVYAKDLGVKIGKPFFKPHFFPILEDQYITVHTDNGVQAKHYDYWDEALLLVKQAAPHIKIIQIGSGKEPEIKKADKFIKTTSIKQSAYIIDKALVHVGIDSSPVHVASHLNTPIVAIYAHTYASTCDPLWGDKSKQVIIESDRDGEKPSFSVKEQDKKINKINPEQIANAILKQLGLQELKFETLFIGPLYKQQILEIIPDNAYDIKSDNIVVRFDLLHEEDNISEILKKNIIAVRTSKPISENLIKNPRIKVVQYVSDSFDEDFVKLLVKLGKEFNLICTSKENLSAQRFKFFDFGISYYNEKEKIENKKKNLSLDKFSYSSNKKVLKNKTIHPSMYAANDLKNLDDFYLDLDYVFVYTLNNE